jgi:CspA family cold shock protein
LESMRGYPMAKGTIKRLVKDRGFGFIKSEQREELFFHRNELQGVEYDSLEEGQEVEFEVGRWREGRPQAVKVRLAQSKSE